MLKSAGVDRFSIAARLHELDQEQVENLSRLYNNQLAIVLRRCDEARFCETFLLQKTHSLRLEESLVPLLPMDKEGLAALDSGPAGPYQSGPELLPEIARKSPIQLTRALAAIALLRSGSTKREHVAAACDALHSKDHALALEAALGLAHWRVRSLNRQLLFGTPYDGGVGLDAHRLREVARAVDWGSVLRPWAAAAFAFGRFPDGVLPAQFEEESEETEEWESFRSGLRDGLTSSDPDLRFTCALALGESDIIAVELDAEDEQRRAAARHFLARHKSPAIARVLIGGSDEIRREILYNLWPPLPDELVDPVLQAAEQGDAGMRREASQLLQPSLTSAVVFRLVKVAREAGDAKVFEVLLDAESLPDSDAVVRSVVEAGLFQTLSDKLPRHIDFSNDLVDGLARSADLQTLELLIRIADHQLQEIPRPAESSEERSKVLAAGRFLARMAFGQWPAQFRTDAYGHLAYHGSSYGGSRWGEWIGPQAVSSLFTNPGEFLCAIADVLKDPGLEQMRLRMLDDLFDHWAELLPHFAECRTEVDALAAALLDRLKEDRSGGACRILQMLIAIVPPYPAEGLPKVVASLSDRDLLSRPWDILNTLRDGYSVFGQWLGQSHEMLANAVGALLELLKVDDYATGQIRPAAADLLTKMATDYPSIRQEIADGITPQIPDWTFFSRIEEELERLATAVGVTIPKAADTRSSGESDLPDQASLPQQTEQLALLDDQMLLPGDPLPTLGKYCRFLSAIGAAANPMETLASFGMTLDQYAHSISAWGELISRRDDVALRYSQLVAARD
jgi:hypothetical protein